MATLCKNCGGSLLFSPSKQSMYCKMCGATFKPEDVEAYGKELLENVDVKESEDVFGHKITSSYECKIYTCNHCGGNISVTDTEASTVCVYCGNPAVVFKRVSKEMRPDGIIPFKVTKDTAIHLIKTHLSRGRFIPSDLKKAEVSDVRGIYIPYWIIDCNFNDAVLIEGDVKHGKRTRTTYFAKAGQCSFRNVPIDASSRFNDNIGKKLEPFIYQEAVDFNEDYLSGFYSDTSDISPQDLRAALLKRCDEMFGEEALTYFTATNMKVVKTCPSADILDTAVYMLIPAWFYTFTYKGKPHTVLVNGQTGKTVGALPFVAGKAVALAAGLFLAIAAAVLGTFIFLVDPFTQAVLSTYGMAFCLAGGIPLMALSISKMKRILANIKDTQAGSTFIFARRRQET